MALAHDTAQVQARGGFRRALARNVEPWLLVAPVAVLIAVFFYGPLLYAFYISLTEWNGGLTAPEFIGLDNYVKLFTVDTKFQKAFANTIYYTLLTVVPSLAFGLGVALLLNRQTSGLIKVYRFVYYLPVITATAVMSVVWKFIYLPTGGLLNSILAAFSMEPVLWLLDPQLAMPSIAITSIWRHAGFTMVIFLAGLQAISESYYEAAKIDGANSWQIFRHITWPLLSPTTFFVLVTSIIGSFQVFDSVRVMTRGGPVDATNVIVYNIYENAFEIFAMGYGSAIAFVLFLMILFMTLVQFKVLGGRVHYE